MRQLKIQKSITNRSSEALDKYLVEIGRAPLISIDEEIELAQQIKKGGPAGERAKDKLVTANLRFVVSVAKQYQHQGLSLTATPVTTKEMRIRVRFAAVAAAVAARKDSLEFASSDQAAFLAQKDSANGKKTMKSYLWSVCAAAYDAEHPGA